MIFAEVCSDQMSGSADRIMLEANTQYPCSTWPCKEPSSACGAAAHPSSSSDEGPCEWHVLGISVQRRGGEFNWRCNCTLTVKNCDARSWASTHLFGEILYNAVFRHLGADGERLFSCFSMREIISWSSWVVNPSTPNVTDIQHTSDSPATFREARKGRGSMTVIRLVFTEHFWYKFQCCKHGSWSFIWPT